MRLSAKITAWHRNYLVLVYIRFPAKQIDLILVLRSQLFEYSRETLYKPAFEHLEATRPEKNGQFFSSSYGKCLTIIDLFEGL